MSHRDHEPPGEAREPADERLRELSRTVSILRSTLDSTTDGILVTDNQRRLVEFNSIFADMWEVPPGVLEARDHPRLIEHVRSMFPDREAFGRRVDEIYASNDEAVDELRRNDGRIYERYSKIQYVDGQAVGRVWSFRDVTRRTHAEEFRWRLAAIVESSNDAIISATLDGVFTTWNAAAVRMFGYRPEEVIGKQIRILYPSERKDAESQILERIRRGERVDNYETQRVCKDGRRLTVSLSVSPIRDESGRIMGMSKIARDITSRKQMEHEREQLLASERYARSQAERASQLKDEFLATLSHELRTPLNAIVGWSQILGMEPPSPSELEEGLEAIERNAQAQTRIIEDLLDMSRIISGKVHLDVHDVDLASVIDAALAAVRPSADAKEIALRKILDTGVGHVAGDFTRLQQVVWNLLSNAVKFTPQGGTIDIYLKRANSHLEIVVRDSGIGIEAEYLSVVFERFRQVDSSSTRNFGGLGLGLSIAKNLVELHGGTIGVVSEGIGKGTTFTVTLPLAPTSSKLD